MWMRKQGDFSVVYLITKDTTLKKHQQNLKSDRGRSGQRENWKDKTTSIIEDIRNVKEHWITNTDKKKLNI